jgi:uncharacterized protein with PIN domain
MKFILTKELGRLARWLRILGFDTVYYRQDNTSRLLLLALREARIVITRNKVLFDKISAKAVYVKEERLREQLKKVASTLKMKIDQDKMFSRCVICNRPLSCVDKREVEKKVPEYVYKTQNKFMDCPECNRVYWPGSHWGNIKKALAKLELI